MSAWPRHTHVPGGGSRHRASGSLHRCRKAQVSLRFGGTILLYAVACVHFSCGARPNFNNHCDPATTSAEAPLSKLGLKKSDLVKLSFWDTLESSLSNREGACDLLQLENDPWNMRDTLKNRSLAATRATKKDPFPVPPGQDFSSTDPYPLPKADTALKAAGLPVSRRRRMCIATSYVGGCKATKSLTMLNKRAYADKHQYYMFAQEHGNGNNKFALILTLLNQGCSWVFWTDADAAFINFDMPLTAFTDHEAADLLLSWDALLPSSNGAAELLKKNLKPVRRGYHLTNTGHFFVKNTLWARKFIDDAWKLVDRRFVKDWGGNAFDQGNILDLIFRRGAAIKGHIAFYSSRAFNSQWGGLQTGAHPKDLILHTPGACRTKHQFWKLYEGMQMFGAPSTPEKQAVKRFAEWLS